MKKLGIIFIILLFISPEDILEEIYELEDLAMVIKDNHLTIEEWTVTIKEKISKKKTQKQLASLKQDYLVNKEENKDTIKYYTDDYYENGGIRITYEITVPQDPNYSPELVVNIEGIGLSETTLTQYKTVLRSIRNQFFTEKSNLFTCLIASKDGMIASDDFSKKVSNDLDLKYISTQSDVINDVSYQEIIYGYTTLWNNEILIDNNPLNVQIVIHRLKNEKQKVIIGTPILITEY